MTEEEERIRIGYVIEDIDHIEVDYEMINAFVDCERKSREQRERGWFFLELGQVVGEVWFGFCRGDWIKKTEWLRGMVDINQWTFYTERAHWNI